MRIVLFLMILFAAMPCVAVEAVKADQNAFTRAAKKPLSPWVMPVKNTKDKHCNSVVECRGKDDLQTRWQVNNTGNPPRDYPAPCYELGKDGKYYYKWSKC
jgi:hypothetical protein